MSTLFSRHPLVLQTAFSELKRQAFEQGRLLVGTPGSVGTRTVRDRRYLYRQFYDAQGKKAAEYLGPASEPATEERAVALREQIEVTKGLIRQGRLLADQGYGRADARTGSILAALVNAGLFVAGATLIGSHAFGALLNALGVAAGAYRTEDIDIASPRRLEVVLPDEASFLDLLRESTVPLVPVPSLDRGGPSTSYKTPGRDSVRVDLLVPARGREVGTLKVRELHAHATALPYLGYLLDAPVDAVVIARECVAPLKVPRPERFAWHKMLVSQLRDSISDKRAKDAWQASILVAALAEDAPDDLIAAASELPRGTQVKLRRGAARVRSILAAAGHERGLDALDSAVRRA